MVGHREGAISDFAGATSSDRVDGRSFLAGGGEMGALMRAHDWRGSSLGPHENWPAALRTILQVVLNTGHPMYIWWGDDGACLYNDAYRQSIGPERHPSSLGRPAREVWDEIWDEIGPQIEHVMAGRGATWHENALVPITRHGRREDVYWTYGYSPIGDATAPGGIGGVLVVCTETTTTVDANQRLNAERERLARLFHHAPGFMTMLSGPEYRFELVNAAYQRLVGNRAVIGKKLIEVIPEAIEQGFVAQLDEVYATGKAFNTVGAPFWLSPAPGAPVDLRYLDFVYQPVVDDAGAVIGVFCEGHDVTERHVARRELNALTAELQERVQFAVAASEEVLTQLHEAQRIETIGRLTGVVAHDFNNLLTPILGGLDVLTRKLGGDERMFRTANVALQAAERAKVLVQRLLAFGRRQTLQSRPVDLDELFHRMRGVFENALGPEVRITIDVAKALPAVEIDPLQFEMALLNLGINARDAMPEGGQLSIVAQRAVDGGQVTIRIGDSGRGMDKDTLARSTEPFFTTKALGQGTGLGLSMVQGLVAQSGGSMSLSSQPGQGTVVELLLPIATSFDAVARPQAALPEIPAATGAGLILLVDDEELVRMSIADSLRDSGYTVLEAASGIEALDHLHVGAVPDVLVTDYLMPGMTGTMLAAAVRERLPGLPVLLITGYSNLQADEARGLEVMSKPFRQPDVVARLRLLIDAAGVRRPEPEPEPAA